MTRVGTVVVGEVDRLGRSPDRVVVARGGVGTGRKNQSIVPCNGQGRCRASPYPYSGPVAAGQFPPVLRVLMRTHSFAT